MRKNAEQAFGANGISVVVPILNEAGNLHHFERLLEDSAVEVIFVDGGSSDDSVQELQRLIRRHNSAYVLESSPGRAKQLAAGAEHATRAWIVFLHADTQLPDDYVSQIHKGENSGCEWGRFDLVFMPVSLWFDCAMRVIAFFINLRSRLTQIATGDQAIFVSAALLGKVGGVPQQPLMEDVEMTRRLKRFGPCYASKSRVTTSARRWRKHGVIRTVLLMWKLRLWYFFGVAPAKLSAIYKDTR